MAIQIRRFRADDIEAIQRLNRRLQAGGVVHRVYPEDPKRTTSDNDQYPSTRLWVARSENEIHGGVWLKEHDFWVAGQRLRAGWAKYPVAESLINPEFGGVPAGLIFRLVRHQPKLMAIGMGGHNTPIARILAGMGWTGVTVPFYFYVVRPTRVFRELAYVRTTIVKRLLCDFIAVSGLGWIGVKVMMAWRKLSRPGLSVPYIVDLVQRFEPWADMVWEKAKESYTFSTVRDCEMLNVLFPVENQSIMRLRVRRGSADLGWACVARLPRTNTPDPHFGQATVGIIYDSFGCPEDARPIMAAATERLIKSDVDIIFTNMAHAAWGKALSSLGFLPGPSNFAFYSSPEMVNAMVADGASLDDIYVTRADGHLPEEFYEL